MTTLMIHAGPEADDAPSTRTGGLPLVPPGFHWPRCHTCDSHMQFLAQIRRESDYLSIFMCQDGPGLCDQWDPDAGGSQVLVFPAEGLTAATPPPTAGALLPQASAVRYVEVEGQDYSQARAGWPVPQDVLGQLGGEPPWIQGDATPSCPECQEPMRLAVRLEQGHDYETSGFFAGGSAYAFACDTHPRAVFLW